DPLDVGVAVLLREPEALGQVRPHRVAVEVLDDRAAFLEGRADEMRDRRLPRPGQPGEPEREAALPPPVALRVLVPVDVLSHVLAPPSGLFSWIPHSSLSDPAQRPARSSSPFR